MLRNTVLSASAALLLSTAASAEELRFAFQADANSMDPYNVNESFTLGFQGNLYEGLIRRGPGSRDRAVPVPRRMGGTWSRPGGGSSLRQGVTFHDGRAVHRGRCRLFGRTRPERGLRPQGASGGARRGQRHPRRRSHRRRRHREAQSLFSTSNGRPGPSCRRDGPRSSMRPTLRPAPGIGRELRDPSSPTARGPYTLVSRDVDVRTEPRREHFAWWERKPSTKGNVSKITMTPDRRRRVAGRGAALGRTRHGLPHPGAGHRSRQSFGPTRTSVLVGAGTAHDLFSASTSSATNCSIRTFKGKNPFQDKRVRQAFYQAIDIEAIKTKVMRGLANPSAMMVGPGINGFDENVASAFRSIPEASKRLLLSEAGYPEWLRRHPRLPERPLRERRVPSARRPYQCWPKLA